jgi:hypothetical protein
MGYRHSWYKQTARTFQGASISNADVTGTSDQFTFLGNSNTASVDAQIALDYVFRSGVTLGVMFAFATNSGDITVRHDANKIDAKDGGLSIVGFGARLGYVHMLNDTFGIWPRLGAHYTTASRTTYSYTLDYSTGGYIETRYDTDVNNLGIDPEIMFVITPVSHFAFLIGAGSSLSLTGGYTHKTDGTVDEEGDYSYGNIGLVAGLMGYF